MPAVAIASVSSVAFTTRPRNSAEARAAEARRNAAIAVQVPRIEQDRGVELREHEQAARARRSRRRARSRGGARRDRADGRRPGSGARRLAASGSAAERARGQHEGSVAVLRQGAALGRVEIAQRLLGDRSGGRSKTISPALRPTMRGNQRSARSTACRLATSVAPRVVASATSGPTRESASVGSSAETGSSARISFGLLVEHAGDADALQLAAREPIAAIEERARRDRGARALRARRRCPPERGARASDLPPRPHCRGGRREPR